MYSLENIICLRSNHFFKTYKIFDQHNKSYIPLQLQWFYKLLYLQYKDLFRNIKISFTKAIAGSLDLRDINDYQVFKLKHAQIHENLHMFQFVNLTGIYSTPFLIFYGSSPGPPHELQGTHVNLSLTKHSLVQSAPPTIVFNAAFSSLFKFFILKIFYVVEQISKIIITYQLKLINFNFQKLYIIFITV